MSGLFSVGNASIGKVLNRNKKKKEHKRARADALLGKDGLTTARFRGSTELTGMPAGTSIGAAPTVTTGGPATPMGGGGLGGRKNRRDRR